MYGKKGVIAPGADADIVVYDPNGHSSLGLAAHHMNMDYSAWEGWEIDGAVDKMPVARLGRSSRRVRSGAGSPRPVRAARAVRPAALEAGDPQWTSSGAAADTAGLAGHRPRQARRALRLPRVWTFDSHLLSEEPYVIYSQILSAPAR